MKTVEPTNRRPEFPTPRVTLLSDLYTLSKPPNPIGLPSVLSHYVSLSISRPSCSMIRGAFSYVPVTSTRQVCFYHWTKGVVRTQRKIPSSLWSILYLPEPPRSPLVSSPYLAMSLAICSLGQLTKTMEWVPETQLPVIAECSCRLMVLSMGYIRKEVVRICVVEKGEEESAETSPIQCFTAQAGCNQCCDYLFISTSHLQNNYQDLH